MVGKRYDTIDDPEFLDLAELIEETMIHTGLENDVSNFFPFISYFKVLAKGQTKMRHFMRYQRDPTYRRIIQEAAQKDKPNFLNSFEKNGFDFTEDEKAVFSFDLITAAVDTLSVTMIWAIATLCNHPEVQKKMAAEIDTFFKLYDRLPEFGDGEHVPYCISTIKECLRFRPTTWFGLPHSVRTDLEVDGYVIPKDAAVIANYLSMHKNPSHYTDPHSFQPERFLDNLKTMQAAANGKFEERDQFNFGFGRRVCPGSYFAEVELFNAFIQMFSRVSIEPVNNKMPDIEGVRNGGITLYPLSYKVKFVKRASSLV